MLSGPERTPTASSSDADGASPPPSSAWNRWLAGVLLVGAIVVPLFFSRNGKDHFRLPKEIALYVCAIASCAIAATGLVLGKFDSAALRKRLRVPAFLTAAGLLWAAVTTLTSTNRSISVDALIWGASLCALVLTAVVAFQSVNVHVVAVSILIPAAVNSVVAILQATGIWNPWIFAPDLTRRIMTTGMLGNADDVGVFLLVPSLVAAAMVLTVRRFRFAYALAALLIISGMAASQTLTALITLTIAGMVLLIVWKPRLGIIAAVALPVVILSGILVVKPLRGRLQAVTAAAREGDWNSAISGRLPAFVVAWEMFRHHPITGVGPGCYKFNYLDYKIEVEDRYPKAVPIVIAAPNFGEVHNDHLQILAEMGAPQYLIVLIAFAWVACGSLRGARTPATDVRARLAGVLSLPLAVAAGTVMLGQFPLQIAAPAYSLAIVGGVCLAWRNDVA